jgi:hypothetical protein
MRNPYKKSMRKSIQEIHENPYKKSMEKIHTRNA